MQRQRSQSSKLRLLAVHLLLMRFHLFFRLKGLAAALIFCFLRFTHLAASPPGYAVTQA